MSELTQYADITNIPTRKAFGWRNKDKKFVIGEREISIAETAYAPPSSEMMPYAPAMTWEGTTEGWSAELPDDVNVNTGVALAIGWTLMRFFDNKSFIVNFYGNPDWAPILNIMASIFGHPEQLIVNDLKSAVSVFNNFPIFVRDLAFENPRLLKEFLLSRNDDTRIIGFSPTPVPLAHQRVLNIPLPDEAPVLIAPKNYGVFVKSFLKTFMRTHKFKDFESTGVFEDDLMAVCALTGFNYMKLLPAFRLKHSKEGLLLDFINDNLDKVYVVAGARIAKALRIKEPDGPIHIRYEIETKMMYIHRAEFRNYYKINDLEEPLKVYRETGAYVGIKKKSMYGGSVVSARQYTHAICIDTTNLGGFDVKEFLYGVGVWSQS